jgi:hypothetical protein
MYVAREKDSERTALFREKKQLSEYIDASVGTIRKNERFDSWEWKGYVIYNPFLIKIDSRRGKYHRER